MAAPAEVKAYWEGERTVDYYRRATANLGLWPSEERVFTRVFAPGDTLLDVGTGTGRVAIGLYELGYRGVLGVDFSRALIAEARQIAQALELPVPFRVMDATRLELGEGVFDGAIAAFNVLSTMPFRADRRKAVAEVWKALRPGGRFVFTTAERGPGNAAFWAEMERRWAAGEPDAPWAEPGDLFRDTPEGRLFVHVAPRAEVLEDLAAAGFLHEADAARVELADDGPEVEEFAHHCRFWVARKPA